MAHHRREQEREPGTAGGDEAPAGGRRRETPSLLPQGLGSSPATPSSLRPRSPPRPRRSLSSTSGRRGSRTRCRSSATTTAWMPCGTSASTWTDLPRRLARAFPEFSAETHVKDGVTYQGGELIVGLDVGVGTSALERARGEDARERGARDRHAGGPGVRGGDRRRPCRLLSDRFWTATSACGSSPSPPARPGPRPRGYWESSAASASRCSAPIASGTCPAGCTPCACFSAVNRCAVWSSATSAGTQSPVLPGLPSVWKRRAGRPIARARCPARPLVWPLTATATTPTPSAAPCKGISCAGRGPSPLTVIG